MPSYPSRYEIGQVVYFHPRIQSFGVNTAVNYGLRAAIGAVKFRGGKVTYELAMDMSPTIPEPEFYDAILVADVDSIFVASLEDLAQWNPEPGVDLGPQAVLAVEASLKYSPEQSTQISATASSAPVVEMSPNDLRKAARRFGLIKADIEEQRKRK